MTTVKVKKSVVNKLKQIIADAGGTIGSTIEALVNDKLSTMTKTTESAIVLGNKEFCVGDTVRFREDGAYTVRKIKAVYKNMIVFDDYSAIDTRGRIAWTMELVND